MTAERAPQPPARMQLIATVLKSSGLMMIMAGVVIGPLQARSDPQRGWVVTALFVAVGVFDLVLARVFKARAAKAADGERAGTRGTPTV